MTVEQISKALDVARDCTPKCVTDLIEQLLLENTDLLERVARLEDKSFN